MIRPDKDYDEIARLTAELDTYKKIVERQQASIEDLSQEHTKQAQRAEQLTAELAQAQAREAQALDALRELYDHQNGCPLPKYEDGWNRAMDMASKLFNTTGPMIGQDLHKGLMGEDEQDVGGRMMDQTTDMLASIHAPAAAALVAAKQARLATLEEVQREHLRLFNDLDVAWGDVAKKFRQWLDHQIAEGKG